MLFSTFYTLTRLYKSTQVKVVSLVSKVVLKISTSIP